MPDEPSADESDAPGYVPMSEWLDDFDRRWCARFATLLRLAGACPHFPRQRASSHELRDHLPRWQAISRQRGPAAARRPPLDRGRQDVHARCAARRWRRRAVARAEGRDRDRQGPRPAARPEDPDRQVQEAHRLQAPHGLPRRSDADRDRVDRGQEEGCGEAEAELPKRRRAGGCQWSRSRQSRRRREAAEAGSEAEGSAAAEPDVAAETAKEDES